MCVFRIHNARDIFTFCALFAKESRSIGSVHARNLSRQLIDISDDVVIELEHNCKTNRYSRHGLQVVHSIVTKTAYLQPTALLAEAELYS